VNASGEKRKEKKPPKRVKKKKRATSLSCAEKLPWREGFIPHLIYWGSSIIYLKYPLGFVIHLVGEENNALLILGIFKRTCGVPINYY